jgi:hypothetical protein
MTTPPVVDPNNSYYQPEAPTPPLKRPVNMVLIGLLVVTILFLAGALIYLAIEIRNLKNSASNQRDSATNSTVLEKDTTTTPVSSSFGVVFKQSDDLWLVTPDGAKTQLTKTGGRVESYVQTPGSPMVAYIQGNKVKSSSEYVSFNPLEVHLLNLETNESKLIYQLIPNIPSNVSPEFRDIVAGIAFSEDETKLVITTSQTINLYDLDTHTLETVYGRPFPTNPKGAVHYYRDPILAPDNQKLAVLFMEFEGGRQNLYDIQSRKVIQTDFETSYGGWEGILGWISPTQMLVYDSFEDMVGQNRPDVSIISYPDLTSTVLMEKIPGGGYIHSVTKDAQSKDIYALRGRRNIGDKFTTFSVAKLDVTAKSFVNEKTFDVEIPDGGEVALVQVSNGRAVLRVTSNPNPSQGEINHIETLHSLDLTTGENTQLN